jgi:hypothetical protein
VKLCIFSPEESYLVELKHDDHHQHVITHARGSRRRRRAPAGSRVAAVDALQHVATGFEIKPTETIAAVFKANPPEIVTIDFEAKPEKTVRVVLRPNHSQTVPVVLRSNH